MRKACIFSLMNLADSHSMKISLLWDFGLNLVLRRCWTAITSVLLARSIHIDTNPWLAKLHSEHNRPLGPGFTGLLGRALISWSGHRSFLRIEYLRTNDIFVVHSVMRRMNCMAYSPWFGGKQVGFPCLEGTNRQQIFNPSNDKF